MASHDLHLTVENGGAGFHQPERSMPGELDHLPDHASSAPQQSSLEYIQSKLAQSSHPTVIIFHLLFKGLALFFYIFGSIFVGGGTKAQKGAHLIALSVGIILLLAADFWVVKNVTGRLLVGLRWWNKVSDDTTTWIFEAAEDQAINAFDRRVFWTVLYATPLVWAALFLLGLLKFNLSWLMVVSMALALNSANVYGYYKCSSDQKQKFQQMMTTGASQGAAYMVRSNVLSFITGTSSASGYSAGQSSTAYT
jgi:hypothetical protein